MKASITPIDQEIRLREDEFIVSKTDYRGVITYTNRVFMHIAGYHEAELLGKQHNIVRHPDMPRGVFRLLWQTLQNGDEFFGYVKNMCKSGAYYWVFANITADYNSNGQVTGYYSVRRRPDEQAINTLEPIYREMLALEKKSEPKEAPAASLKLLQEKLSALGVTYNELIISLDK
ncbi:MAG: PAS domain-containing protein [Pontibacterium sp.]